METLIAPECPAEAVAWKLDRIERLRDALPVASRVVRRITGGLSASMPMGFERCDEVLIEQSERLRDALAATEPKSLEGAVAQMKVAERDWLSGDPQLRQRAVSLIGQALQFMGCAADALTQSPAGSRALCWQAVAVGRAD